MNQEITNHCQQYNTAMFTLVIGDHDCQCFCTNMKRIIYIHSQKMLHSKEILPDAGTEEGKPKTVTIPKTTIVYQHCTVRLKEQKQCYFCNSVIMLLLLHLKNNVTF
jgi:hypothetical protein